jgi:hypothetical protein
MNGACFGAACTGSSGQVPSPLKRPNECVWRVIDRDPCRSKNDVRVEPPVEQELSGIVTAARKRGQQMGRGRLLASLFSKVFGGASKPDKLRLPGL